MACEQTFGGFLAPDSPNVESMVIMTILTCAYLAITQSVSVQLLVGAKGSDLACVLLVGANRPDLAISGSQADYFNHVLEKHRIKSPKHEKNCQRWAARSRHTGLLEDLSGALSAPSTAAVPELLNHAHSRLIFT